jgi:hypothetical protein
MFVLASSFPAITQVTLTSDKIWIQVTLGQHFTFTNPDFDSDLTINSKRKYIRIINIHSQRVQRRATLFDFFSTRDFCSTQSSGNFDLYSFGSHT